MGMKPVKLALSVVAGLALLAAIAMAFIVANFDANKFKGELAGLIKEQTQRTLEIDGTIKLAFFPKIGVELGKLSLSEQNSRTVFAAVDSARVSVELLPLLSQKIVVDRIAIDGLRAKLMRRKDGGSNFDDLLGGPAAPGEKQGGAAAFRLDIAGIDIRNTDLEWADEAKNQRFAIKGLRLETGRLGAVPSKFKLELQLASTQPAVAVRINASGSLSLDPQAGHYRLAGLAATANGAAWGVDLHQLELQGGLDLKPDAAGIDGLVVKFTGKRGGEGIEADLGISKAQIAKQTVRAENISLALKLARTDGNIDATLRLPGLEGAGSAFKAADLALELAGKQGDNAFKGSLASPISGDVEAERYQLSRLSGNINVTGPNLPKGAVTLSLTGDATVDLARKTAQLNLAAGFDQSHINAKLGLTQFSPLALAFDLGVDQLNLDNYLAPKKEPKNEQGAQGAPEKPIDLSALKAVNANGAIKIGALQVSGIKAGDINAKVRLVNGRLDVSPHSAKLYQGSVSGALTADANGNRYTLKEELRAISIGPLLKDVADKDVLEGRGDVALDLSSAGNSIGALKKGLGGTARIDLKDGAIKGINLAEALRKAKSALGAKGAAEQGANAQDKTDFSELAASFAIRNGVAHNDDLALKSPFLRLSGSGDINIGGDSIDYLAKVAVVASAGGQGGKDLAELKGVTVPVRLSGPYDALKYRIDFGAMVTETAKEKARDAVKNAISEKLGIGAAKPGPQKAEPKDQARELLKGLFGR